MKINCLIIDDEPASQTVLKKFIEDVDFLELRAVCDNAIEAIEKLKELNDIDLLFLDVNMPKISGLTFYKSLQNPPHVIFTTAYPQYAVDGFEVNAIDFLLKPFSFERFFTAVNKVLEKRFSNGKQTNGNQSEDERFIFIKSNKTLHKINFEDILFVEAYGDYVKAHLDDKYILTNATFTSVLDSLPKKMFIRTHKSFAINFKKMTSISGNQITIQKHKIPIGLKFKEEFMKIVNDTNQ
ncbi:LytR/AlgR family response regulator transcription factor [Seonamhaeicola aphaedonensis]|uniref:LytTR family two component transcriptional regulator n=1 Tax=Seonamhaeicola aphaedonensis TaxID=1461338 RepID=A0A3D9HKP0_9FLAO|nr:LytTR family DNA-binding domain-containing protein [Seonamhaeicola aphaedonensis]RED49985.1 LytTR family two component transcriptional regulator [Seonamhaeicola aphaedonensis]